MSTTFGVKIPNSKDIVEVAFRSNGIRWTNELAILLPNEIEIIAMDNDNQEFIPLVTLKTKWNVKVERL